MTCHHFAGALVDIARGGNADTPDARAALTHARQCPACRAHLDRERELTSRLRAFAVAAPPPPSAVLESRLQVAFAAHPRREAADRRVWRWTAVAACVLVAAAAWSMFAARPHDAHRQPIPSHALAAVGAPALIEPLRPTAISLAPPRPLRAARTRAAPERAAPPFGDFIALEGVAALPAFESGRIVRIDLPLAALPAYGIEMVPDATPQSFPADVLIGQDGLPRAIRLASTTSIDRSRR